MIARHYNRPDIAAADVDRIGRTNPVLVRVVEKLGLDANGLASDLKVIDADIDRTYYVRDNDGLESITSDECYAHRPNVSMRFTSFTPNIRVMAPQDDLFATRSMYICDAVNCVGPHSAGIAAQFERFYPRYSGNYRTAAKAGMVKFSLPPFRDKENEKVCLAVPTMFNPGERARVHNIATSLYSLRCLMDGLEPEGVDIATPALGCGIGGLSFDTLIHLVAATFGDDECKHTISLYPPR